MTDPVVTQARKVLADQYEADDMASVAEMLRAGGDGHMATQTVLKAMLTFAAQARLEGERAGMEKAANICGSLAETTYDDSDGFAAATGCEAAIYAANAAAIWDLAADALEGKS